MPVEDWSCDGRYSSSRHGTTIQLPRDYC